MNNFYCEFQDLVSSWLIQINDFFLKFVFSDVINFILKIKYTKKRKYSIGFISRKKNWKKPMKTSAWQLLNLWWLDTTIIFYKNRGLAKLPCLETATMTYILSPLLKNFFNKFICVDYTQFESPPARKPA